MNNRIISGLILCASFGSSFAGSMGDVNSTFDFNGFYAGLGTGFTTFFVNDSYSNSFSNASVPSQETIRTTDTAVLFDAHLGYGQFVKPNTYLGAKASIYYTPLEHLGRASKMVANGNILNSDINSNQISIKLTFRSNKMINLE